jgi:hypothetical protein
VFPLTVEHLGGSNLERGLDCGIFGSGAANFRRREIVFRAGVQKPKQSQSMFLGEAGASLARHQPEDFVFRAAVFSIVLTVALTPNAAVLCTAWCHPEETKSTCEHQEASTSRLVTGEDSCRTIPAAAAAFLREEAKRGAPPGSLESLLLPFQQAPPPTDTDRTNDVNTSLALGSPPLLIPLRI